MRQFDSIITETSWLKYCVFVFDGNGGLTVNLAIAEWKRVKNLKFNLEANVNVHGKLPSDSISDAQNTCMGDIYIKLFVFS